MQMDFMLSPPQNVESVLLCHVIVLYVPFGQLAAPARRELCHLHQRACLRQYGSPLLELCCPLHPSSPKLVAWCILDLALHKNINTRNFELNGQKLTWSLIAQLATTLALTRASKLRRQILLRYLCQ